MVGTARDQSRISAYVYGDVLMLAAVGGLARETIRSGEGLWIVVGTLVSTYVAHVLADLAGAGLASRPGWTTAREEFRDSLPIISAGLPCFALFIAAHLSWLSALAAQIAVLALLIGRLAATGLIYRRFTARISLGRALWVGLGVALAGALAAGLKVSLTH